MDRPPWARSPGRKRFAASDAGVAAPHCPAPVVLAHCRSDAADQTLQMQTVTSLFRTDSADLLLPDVNERIYRTNRDETANAAAQTIGARRSAWAASWPFRNFSEAWARIPSEVLGELGYDLKLFDDAENRISYAVRNHILSHCAARTGCPHFGLLVGQHNGLHTFGLMGLLVKYAPDVETALRSFVRYLHLHVQGASVNLAVDGNSAMLTWQVHEPGMEAIDHIGDGALATLYNIMHELCGPDWRPTEVWFAHRRPADVGPFRRFFRVPLRFDAEQYALLFSAGFLKRRLPGIDDEVARSAAKRRSICSRSRHRDDFPAQVRSVLHTALLTGQCQGRPGRRALRNAQPHPESPPQRVRRRLPATRGRDPLRDRPADAGIFGDGDRHDLRAARLRRPGRVHEGVSPLERHDAREWRATPAGARLYPSKGLRTQSTPRRD